MKTPLIDHLHRAGLSHNEAIVYDTLLRCGAATPATIADKAHINRTTTYRILEHLSIKGLVSSLHKKHKLYFQAEGGNALQLYTRNQIDIAERALMASQKITPDIEELLRMSSYTSQVKFFEGKEGIKHIFMDHIAQEHAYEMLGFSNVKNITTFLGASFIKKYIDRKIALGVTSRGIFPDDEQDLGYVPRAYARAPKKLRPLIRTIPSELFPFESELTIYGDHGVSMVSVHHNELVGIIIEDMTMHNMMKMIFELAWKGAGT